MLAARIIPSVSAVASVLAIHAAANLDKSGTQWYPYVEWSVTNKSVEGNPFDLQATATFSHSSGESRRTALFYAGEDVWKFRFTATRTGVWKFTTFSADP